MTPDVDGSLMDGGMEVVSEAVTDQEISGGFVWSGCE